MVGYTDGGTGGCIGGGDHVWRVVGAVFAEDAQVEWACERCAALSVDTSATLNPGINTPGLEDPFLYRDPELGSGGGGPA